MNLLLRLAGVLLATLLLQLASCAPIRHDAQAAPAVRHRYHRSERRNEHRRRRLGPPQLPWAGPDLPSIQRLDSSTARNWAVRPCLFHA